jgi:uncharacterized membrane protein YphA (DoxX/SURF4 family)
MSMPAYNFQIAECVLRYFAALLFLFQGYDKLFKIGMPAVIDTFMTDASRYHVPRWFVSLVAWFSSLTEFAGGILLGLGFMTDISLYALSLDILVVSFAFSFLDPMWDLKHVFPRMLLIVTLLLLPPSASYFRLDNLLIHR